MMQSATRIVRDNPDETIPSYVVYSYYYGAHNNTFDCRTATVEPVLAAT